MRAMQPDELPRILDWAAAEGWNPGLDDAAAFAASDPGGFFVACIDGVPVAAISVVNHSGSFAFLGLYLCLPAYRGRGIGLALWRHAMAHAGDRTVGLDGVPDQQENYRRSGFVRVGQTQRFEGAVAPEAHPAVGPVGMGDLDALVALDEAVNGVARPAFARQWFTDAENRRTLVWRGSGGTEAVVTVRRCRRGVKCGPLIAPDADRATRMVRAAAGVFGGDAVIVDVPQTARDGAALVAAFGLQSTFETARMYRGPAPMVSADLCAVATMELG